jgi:PAS domain S-box-containing protein
MAKKPTYEELEKRIRDLEEAEVERQRTEDALKKSEEMYRRLIESAVVGIYQVEKEGEFVMVNQKMAEMFGYDSPQDFLSNVENIANIYARPEERSLILQEIDEKGFVKGKEIEFLRKNGESSWIRLHASSFRDKDKVIYEGLMEDITERKRVEEELQKLASVVKYSSELVNLATLDGKMIFLNEAGGKILGISPDEVERINIMDVIPDHLIELVQNELLPELIRGNTWEGELQYRNIKTGDLTDVHAMTFTVQDPNTGKPLFLANVSLDITERKLAEKARRESEERYRAFIDNAPIGMYTINTKGEFTYGNKKLSEMTGYKIEDWQNNPFHPIVHPEDLGIVLAKIEKRLSGQGTTEPYELRIFHASGEIMWVKINSESIYEEDESGEKRLVGMQSFVEDITNKKATEESLRESEERFRETVELLPNIVCEYDTNGRFAYVNKYGLEKLGYTLADLESGLYAKDVFSQEELSKFGDRFSLLLKGEKIPSTEYRVSSKDNSVIDVIATSSPIYKQGKIVGARSSVTPITELKQIEKSLRESERKYKEFANSLPQVVFETDVEGNLTFINRLALDIFGYTQTDFEKGLNALEMLIPEDRNRAVRNVQRVIQGEILGGVEYTALRKDGSTFPIIIHSSRIDGDEGDKGLRGIIIDITDRKRAEDAVKHETDFRRVLGAIASEFITTSLKEIDESITRALEAIGEFVKADRSYIIIFDYQAETISNTHEWCSKGIEPQLDNLQELPIEIFSWFIDQLTDLQVVHIPQVADLPPEAVGAKEAFEAEGIQSLLLVPLVSEGRCFGAVGFDFVTQARSCSEREIRLLQMSGATLSNVFQRKRAEEALRESEEKLARSKKMESIGLLAGGVAHDLNNVLSGIVSYPELLLLDLPEDSRLKKPLETMQESGHRAVAIVQDLLTVARGVATTKEPLNINDMVRDYLNSPELKKLKEFHPTVAIQTNLDSNLLNVRGSHIHIRKVVMNLVSNASESIEGIGNVTISTENRYIDRPLKGYDDVNTGEYAVLAVSDDGSGISSYDLERIFEPFYTKKVMGRSGTGLGLAVVWNVIQDHKGYIDVKSDEEGTTFELYFPITRDEISDQALSKPIKAFKGKGEKILIVDDVESQRDITCKILETLGYKTKVVSSGEEAVEYLKENKVDLILLDMIMDPGINGRETYERIIEIHPRQKAIIVSGFAETDEVREAQKLGAGKYIKKPLTLEKIGLAVREELDK